MMKYKQWEAHWCVLFLKHEERVLQMKLLLCVHNVVISGVQYGYIFDGNADDCDGGDAMVLKDST